MVFYGNVIVSSPSLLRMPNTRCLKMVNPFGVTVIHDMQRSDEEWVTNSASNFLRHAYKSNDAWSSIHRTWYSSWSKNPISIYKPVNIELECGSWLIELVDRVADQYVIIQSMVIDLFYILFQLSWWIGINKKNWKIKKSSGKCWNIKWRAVVYLPMKLHIS